MGFPLGYTEVFLPKLFVRVLCLLGFIRHLIFSLFHSLGLSDFLDTDAVSFPAESRGRSPPESPPVSALLIREMLPVVKFESLVDPPESCAVCLYEFEGRPEEEIRWLSNCRHVFHRECLDRWMDCDQDTCPLCRTQFVPDDMREEFNQRLRAASAVVDFAISED
ncbi:brassinosteroid-responsive RING protein 1 [Rhodamnia argentea]|uniref:Brassinosteroid-responsive RING protein 1 n=1 Tax=Rhodamnia argentea TaxID=178133 RepID=A0A8B8QLK8_9MYRT|nr:brassinosteroid-responsive RING protein 1 [Rhodamnia argentea]